MIARSDRTVPRFSETSGDEVRSPWLHSGSTAPTMAPARANRWGAKAKPPVFTHASGGFAVNVASVPWTLEVTSQTCTF
jgi:hypothetical protein